jgi:hypothetical protein
VRRIRYDLYDHVCALLEALNPVVDEDSAPIQ